MRRPSSVRPRRAAADGDLEISFNDHCRECHSFLKDDNRLGPSLYGVVGRKAGTEPGFAYSNSVKSSGVTWDEATLDKWIANPDAVIPGNDHEPALWRRGRSRDPQEDHRLPEDDLAAKAGGTQAIEAPHKCRRRPEIRPPPDISR